MNRVNFSARSFLRSNKNKDGSQTVGLRVTYLNQKKDYSLDIKISANDYRQIKRGSSLRLPQLINKKRSLEDAVNNAYTVFKELGSDFSFNRFKDKYFGTEQAQNGMKSILVVIDEYMQSKNISYSTRLGYNTLKNKIIHIGGDLSIKEIDKQYFERFKTSLSNSNLSWNSVVVNLRYLRAVIYYAQEIGYINPFKLKVPLAKQDVTRGYYIQNDGLDKIFKYSPQSYYEQRALDYFKISFFMQGANIADILKLKRHEIHENKILFNRSKVERTSSNSLIGVHLSDYLKELIINNQAETNDEDYVFPVLVGKKTEQQKHNAKYQFLKNVNKHLDNISKKLNFKESITTYCARHSFTSYLKEVKKADINEIQPLLGHKSITSTARYIDKLNRINSIQLNLEADFNLGSS